MANTIEARVDESFNNVARDDMVTYMDWIRSTMADLSQNLRRSVATALLLVAVFELVTLSPKTQLAIGSFKIYGGSIVVVFIPALISFFYLQTVSDTNRLVRLQGIFSKVFGKWLAKAEENDLDLYALPPQALYWYINYTGDKANMSRPERQLSITAIIFVYAILIGVLIFEGQAYYRLFHTPITHEIPWLISASVALFCLTMSIIGIIAND